MMAVLHSLIAGWRTPSTMGPDDEAGQGLAEYALILALIALVTVVALIFLGGQINDALSKVGQSVADAL